MSPLPLVRPMLAVAGPIPVRDDGRFAVEMKWDGVRAVSYWDGGQLRLLSRNDNDVTPGYPELAALGSLLGSHGAILDGEIVAYDRGRPSFEALQARLHVRGAKVNQLAAEVPVTLLLFDIMQLDGTATTGLTYTQRRELLEGLDLTGDHVLTPPAFHDEPKTVLAASLAQGLEGVVAKAVDSTYLPGRRSPSWIKVKHEHTQEVIIGGWKPGEGGRAGRIGSLLLGINNDAGELIYVGHVGTGFTDRVLADLASKLEPLHRKTSPFTDEVPRLHARDAVWVTPSLVGEVSYGEFTREHRLRHPSWRGLRPDKSPTDVHREP
ncbi:MAG TPA: non-homologous end-joining DNA ligase [Acidothermaceae bacterium]